MFEMICLVGAAALPFAAGMWSALISGILGGFLICDLPLMSSSDLLFLHSIALHEFKFMRFG